MSIIIKCKYAGDSSDEGCKICDGIKLLENGSEYDANECGGYEPEQTVKHAPAKEHPAESAEISRDSLENQQVDNLPIKGITSVIRAESGVSLEINGTWFKFTFSEERILPEGADVTSEKAALWDSVNAEVDAQVDAVRG